VQPKTQEGNHNAGQEESNQEYKKMTMTMTMTMMMARMNATNKT
jgi:hypothetical protein